MPIPASDNDDLAPGRMVELPGRGTTFVREMPGPAGAMTLILLHGLAGTADLSWHPCFVPLGEVFRVLAPDLRGHGDGIRLAGRFSLEQCADDVAALADVVGVEDAIVAGYSLGGFVAQLVWRHHRGLVAGLVLCATAGELGDGPIERLMLSAVPGFTAAMRLLPPVFQMSAQVLGPALYGQVADAPTRRWMDAELGRTDLGTTLEAGAAATGFRSVDWLDEVDVPTAVVVTTRDHIVRPALQRGLARAIPGATTHEIDADHGACITDPDLFVPALVRACRAASHAQSPG